MGDFLVGLDLGQSRDPSAIVVVESVEWTAPPPPPPPPSVAPTRKRRFMLGFDLPVPTPPPPPARAERHYHVRHCERLRLGTSYPAVVARVARILAAIDGGVTLAIDATGVGRPVVDLFEAMRIYPVAVTLTSGDGVTQDGSRIRVPKRDVVTAVEVLLQERRLKIGHDVLGCDALVDELLSFRVGFTPNGRDIFNAESAAHDDLVIALALACWYGRYTEQRPASPMVGISQPWEDRDDPDAMWLGDPEHRYGYRGGGSRFIGGGSRGIPAPRYFRLR